MGNNERSMRTNLLACLVYVFPTAPSQAQLYIPQEHLFPDGTTTDYFGWSLAVDGDRMAVGAPRTHLATALEAGAVYLYAWDATTQTWVPDGSVEQQPEPIAGKEFGTRVALGNDRLVVANTPGCYDGSGTCTLMVFERQGPGDWQYYGDLFVPNAVDQGLFGGALAMDGDVVVIGGGRAGDLECVAVYDLAVGLAPAQLIVEDAAFAGTTEGFGSSLAVDQGDLLIGSPGDDELGLDGGAAFVYGRNAGGADQWGYVRKFLPSNGAAGDAFGATVAVRDGFAAIIARNKEWMGTSSGVVYTFRRDLGFPGNWGEMGFAGPDVPDPNSLFGYSVAMADGVILVGAPNDDSNLGALPKDGAVYVFASAPNSGPPVQTQRIGAEENLERFGNAVAFAPSGFVAGAPWNNLQSTDDGMVRVYRTSAVGMSEQTSSTAFVSPNPFGSAFIIRSHGSDITSWRLFDPRGCVVLSGRLLAGYSSLEVERGSLRAGVYLLSLEAPDGTTVFRERLIAE